jgi:NhaA family Na+:H+ antiporter
MGAAAVAGIGFTVSIFIAGLAFDDDQLVDEAKVGILVASLLASGIGALFIQVGLRKGSAGPIEANGDEGEGAAPLTETTPEAPPPEGGAGPHEGTR